MSQVTTYGGIAIGLRRTLIQLGVDPNPLFAEVGMESPERIGSQNRVPAVAMQKLWRLATVTSKDDAFGIHYAKTFQPTALHGLGFAWLASDTLKDAFNRLVRYYRLITTAGEVSLSETDEEYCLWYKIPAPKGVAAPASLDAALALFVQICRITKGVEFTPTLVELQRTEPINKNEFNAFFKCPISFDCDENRLYFDKASLNEALPGANPELARVNDQVVIDYLKSFDKGDIINQIRANIIEALPDGAPTQDDIAASINMSTRSMQRKLKESGTSFKKIVEEVRKELALAYMKDGVTTIGEITYMLGFSEPSNFSRSFKKWVGQSPAAYQATLTQT